MKAEMTNEKIPTVDVPQTGDSSMTGFWIGLGAIALGGLVALLIIRKRTRMMSKMKKVYICSPFSGDVSANLNGPSNMPDMCFSVGRLRLSPFLCSRSGGWQSRGKAAWYAGRKKPALAVR